MMAAESSGARQALLAGAIGVAVAAQFAIHADHKQPLPWAALAVAALTAALVAGRRAAAALAPSAALAARPRHVLALLAVGASAAATVLAHLDRWPIAALLCWLAIAGLGALAVRGRQATPASRPALPWTGAEWLALALLLLLGGLARFAWVDTLPWAIFGDEPRVAMYLNNAYLGGRIPNFFRMGWNTWPVIGLSLHGLFVPVQGLDIATLRLSSALFGTLSVAATYLLARELSGPRLALLAALLFAVCRTAIDFSRLGVAHAQVIFLEPLALFHLWRALNGGRAVHWWMAGVATAWCMFSYNAGQLVPPLVFGWLGLAALRRPARLATHWRGAALCAAGFALILFPYLWYVTDGFQFGPNWSQFTIMARNRQTMGRVLEAWQTLGAGPAWEILERQIWVTWLGFGVLPGAGYLLGYRGGGMLDDVSAALFVLGLAMTLRRLARPRDGFLVYWWLATVLAGGIATADPPATVRMVGLLPALALLAATPLDWLIATGGIAWRRAAGIAVVALIAAGAAAINWQTYFVDFAAVVADPNSELARYLHRRAPDQRALLLGPEHHLALHQELFLIEFPGRASDEIEVAHALPLRQPVETPLTLVLGPSQDTQAAYIQSLYPGAAVHEVRNSNGVLYFRTVDLDPAEVRARAGLTLVADGGAPAVADPFAPAPGTRRVWTGQLYWPSNRPLALEAVAERSASVQIGEQPPLAAGGGRPVSATFTLARGWQPIRIEDGGETNLRLTISGDGPPLTVSRWHLRPERERQGLAAAYTVADGGVVRTLDPQINAYLLEQRLPAARVRTPFRATWRGALRVEQAGTYGFDAVGSGPYRVVLDGRELLAVGEVVPEQPKEARTELHLEPGLHSLEATFDSQKLAHTTRRIFQLFWTPPGGERQLIPPTHLVPPADA